MPAVSKISSPPGTASLASSTHKTICGSLLEGHRCLSIYTQPEGNTELMFSHPDLEMQVFAHLVPPAS
jgi:hypothetical protein